MVFRKIFRNVARFSCFRKQRVVLNGQHLLFLIYKNDLSNDRSSNCKLFADDRSLFSVVNLAFQWKIIFNLDLSKQTQEVILTRKINKLLHPTLLFNNT